VARLGGGGLSGLLPWHRSARRLVKFAGSGLLSGICASIIHSHGRIDLWPIAGFVKRRMLDNYVFAADRESGS
jgi:hypothetical protein